MPKVKETGLIPKGVSGNPAGRPKGAVGKATEFRLAVQGAMMDELHKDALKLVKVLMQDALDGNDVARKIIMDRLLPAKKAVDGDKDNTKGNIIINVTTKKDEITTVIGEVFEHTTE